MKYRISGNARKDQGAPARQSYRGRTASRGMQRMYAKNIIVLTRPHQAACGWKLIISVVQSMPTVSFGNFNKVWSLSSLCPDKIVQHARVPTSMNATLPAHAANSPWGSRVYLLYTVVLRESCGYTISALHKYARYNVRDVCV